MGSLEGIDKDTRALLLEAADISADEATRLDECTQPT
jgi:hypothetical protein